MNNLDEAERWLNQEENDQENPDNIGRPNTKWVFVKFFNVEVKAVLDRQPLLGTGPLSAWRRNLARWRVLQIVSLDTFNDNLYLWSCIAVPRGARAD